MLIQASVRLVETHLWFWWAVPHELSLCQRAVSECLSWQLSDLSHVCLHVLHSCNTGEWIEHTNVKSTVTCLYPQYIDVLHKLFVSNSLRTTQPCSAVSLLRNLHSSPQLCCLSVSGCEPGSGLMSSFSNGAEVSLRTETRKEGRGKGSSGSHSWSRTGRPRVGC